MTKRTRESGAGRRSAVACRGIVVCIALIAVLMSACGVQETLPPLLPPEEGAPTETAAPPTETPMVSPTDAPQETAAAPTEAPVEAPTLVPTETPQPTAEPLADWARYVNADYGFSFRFPPEWSIELLSDRPGRASGDPAAEAVRLTEPQRTNGRTTEVLIEYRRADQAVAIGPDSLPDGEIAARGTVHLLDRVLPKYVLVHEEKEKVAFVGEQFVDLELFVQMQEIGDDLSYAEIEIPASAHEVFDQILASVSRGDSVEGTDLYPEWETYNSRGVTPGFSFRYPATWALYETPDQLEAATLVLSKETYLLTVQVKAIGSSYTLGPETTPEGLIMEAGTASFMQRLVPRNVLIHEEKLKMVFLTLQTDALEFYIELTQDPDQVPYAEIDLPEAVRHEMDQILASFQPQPQE